MDRLLRTLLCCVCGIGQDLEAGVVGRGTVVATAEDANLELWVLLGLRGVRGRYGA